ncbi:MAG: hypothetical protein ISP71_02685 [Flavobacteriales bacterium]|nr:hypothetical protein [Flavobacteriales bacterium]
MKKLNLKRITEFTFALSMSIFILSSCSKNEFYETNSVSERVTEPTLRQDRIKKGVIGLYEAKLIGRLHNTFLEKAFINHPTSIDVLKRNFYSINRTIPPKSLTDLFLYFEKNNSLEIELEINRHLSNQASKTILNQIKRVVYNNDNYLAKSKSLDNIVTKIDAINGKDKEILLVLIETSRASLKFWMPKVNGGMGRYDDYIERFDDVDEFKVNWKAIAWADGAGAAGTLLRTWALASFGPLGWGTIVGAIGFGAAWASGSALLYQLM